MIRWLADENLNGKLIRGLYRARPQVDLVRIQDVGLTGAPDPAVLAWSADASRLLLTHDVATIARYAYERLDAGLPMAGVCIAGQELPMRAAIEDLLLLDELSETDEWFGRVVYLPL